jgi:hypothetical protein
MTKYEEGYSLGKAQAQQEIIPIIKRSIRELSELIKILEGKENE